MNSPTNFLPKKPENKQTLSRDESNMPGVFADGTGEMKNNPGSEKLTAQKGLVDGKLKVEPPTEG